MALDFSGNANAVVDYGSGAALDNAIPFTRLFWFRLRTGFATNDRFWTKSTSADASIHVHANDEIRLRSFTGDPAVAITNDSPLLGREDDWLFLAVTYDDGAAQFGHIYTGDLTTVVTERTLGVNNNTAWGDDSAQSYAVGNRSSLGLNLTGEIAMFADFDFAMTLAEIRRLQYDPTLWSGAQRIFTIFGFNGTGSQPDLSGHGHTGTPADVTVADHVPLRPPFGFDQFLLAVAAAVAVTSDAVVNYEALLGLTQDKGVNYEALLGLTQDKGVNYEALLGLTKDEVTNYETLISILKDAVSPFESAQSILNDAGVNFEALQSVTKDETPNIEAEGVIISDQVVNYEALVTLTKDAIINFETLQSIQQDAQTPMEVQGTATEVIGVTYESLITVQQNAIVNFESLVGLLKDAGINFESLVTIATAPDVNFEALAGVLKETVVIYETLVGIQKDVVANIEALQRVQQDAEVEFESSGKVTQFAAANFEAVGAATQFAIINLSTFFVIAAKICLSCSLTDTLSLECLLTEDEPCP